MLSSFNLNFETVMGHDDVKEVLCKKVIAPINNKKLYGDSGVRHPVCILLHGPTGCGKTKLMRALANESGTKICILTSYEIKLIRSGEGRRIFKDVFQRAAGYGTSSIVFIENLSELCSRGRRVFDVMNYLLEEMNRASDLTDVYVVISSNSPRIKFDLFVRPGFISTTLYVGLPCSKEMIQMFPQYFKENEVEIASDFELDEFCRPGKYYTMPDWTRFIFYIMQDPDQKNKWRSIVSREHFMIALNKIRPSTSSKVVRKFKNRQSRYEKILKNAVRIKSDVLAKSFSRF